MECARELLMDYEGQRTLALWIGGDTQPTLATYQAARRQMTRWEVYEVTYDHGPAAMLIRGKAVSPTKAVVYMTTDSRGPCARSSNWVRLEVTHSRGGYAALERLVKTLANEK